VLAAKLGAKVTHLDASKPSITAAKENMLLSGLPEDAIRWILDDATKFVKREATRGNKYDAIILDPPAFGRGAKGEVWKFNEDLPILLQELKKICSDDFQFMIVNAYAVSVSALLLKNLLEDFSFNMETKNVDYGELILKEKSGRMLSTGIFARLY
jgi:23S rRNA (cytosine1962-C5)-methyltransferase